MQLDPILGLAARAIQAVVDPLGRADIEARDDEPDVEMLFRQQFRRDLRDNRFATLRPSRDDQQAITVRYAPNQWNAPGIQLLHSDLRDPSFI